MYIYITVQFIIFTFWKLSLLFLESLLYGNLGVRKPPVCRHSKTSFCWNIVRVTMWLDKPFHLVFKYQLIDFTFYHTNVCYSKLSEASSKTLAVQILSTWSFENLSSFLNIYHHGTCFWSSFKRWAFPESLFVLVFSNWCNSFQTACSFSIVSPSSMKPPCSVSSSFSFPSSTSLVELLSQSERLSPAILASDILALIRSL